MGKDKVWHDFETHMLHEGVTAVRIKKLKTMYNVCSRCLPMPLDRASREDLMAFLDGVNRNNHCKKNGQPFSGSTKADIKKFLKQYFKWKKGDSEVFPKEVRWIKARISKEEQPKPKEIVSREETLALSLLFRKPEHTFATLMLFDAGFRISELLSIRKKDLSWEHYSENEFCWWLSCNHSKTFVRKVDIPLFNKQIREFRQTPYFENLSDSDLLFSFSKSNYAKALKGVARKLFNGKKTLSPHSLRHSSATFYAKEYNGNMMMLCQRYGWAFGSDIAKVYVRMSGAYQKTAARVVHSNEVTRLRREMEFLKQKYEELSTIVMDNVAKETNEKKIFIP